MPAKVKLPVYAIVELLMRLAHLDKKIGSYKDHRVHDGYTLVKTTGGSICFPGDLVDKQFNDPEQITNNELAETLVTFKPAKI